MPGRDELIALARAGRWDVYDAAEVWERTYDTTFAGGIVLGGRLNALVFIDADRDEECPFCLGDGFTSEEDDFEHCLHCAGSGEWVSEHPDLALLINRATDAPDDYPVRIVAMNGEPIAPAAMAGLLERTDHGAVLSRTRAKQILDAYACERLAAELGA